MEPKKKMTLMQLTVIVAVNMMGSGIIMLPANMAKVGAISLLSWGVTWGSGTCSSSVSFLRHSNLTGCGKRRA